ncbi:MAG TPA: hypothetical protein VJH03_18045 [Blastocatellia bacterium]|nr:hypothetical protein [Blastocatellia bacterium]
MTTDRVATTAEPLVSRVVASDGAIDRQQLRALIRLNLKQSFRGVLKPGTGRRSHPIRQIVFSMGFIGLLFSTGAMRCEDLATYLVLLFSAAFAIVALSVLPDTLDGRRRNVEIISSKPIAPATSLAARTINLLVVASLVVGSFALAPLVSAVLVFKCGPALVAGLVLLLLLGSFAVVVISLTTLVVAARWFNLDRLRVVAQFLLVAINLGLMGLSFLAMGSLARDKEAGGLSLTSAPLVKLLPSAWYADWLVSDFGTVANLERAGAVLFLAGALWVALRLDIGRRYPQLIDRLLAADERPAARPFTVRLLELLRGLPLVGRWLAPPQPAAVASLILTLTQREVMSRIKILVPRVILIVFFVVSVTAGDRYFSPLIIAFYGFMGMIDGCEIIKHSSEPAAGWLLAAAPADARQILRGMRLAITLKYFALPAVLVTTALFIADKPMLAALFAISYLVEARCLVSLVYLMSPALPLSRDHATARQFTSVALSLAVTVITTIAYVLVSFAYEMFGYFGLAVGVVGVIGLGFASYGLDRGAAARMGKLECEH